MGIDHIFADLNDEQREAVIHEQGPLLILAGAGSGKTKTITHRIAWLIAHRNVYPGSVLAMTFTNKAAGEMRHRILSLLGEYVAPEWVGTFHSICLRILRRHAPLLGYPASFVIYDDQDQKRLLSRIVKEHFGEKESIHAYRSFISSFKDRGMLEVPKDMFLPHEEKYVRIFEKYQRGLKLAGAMDFDDLLCQTFALLRDHPQVREAWQNRFEHVVVDEFQDTNIVQYELLKLLLNERRNLCVVGDDDQCIYSWRGANIGNILGFTRDFPDTHVVSLHVNYRSQATILNVASHIIGFNRNRHPKKLTAIRDMSENVQVFVAQRDQEEASFILDRIRRLYPLLPYSSIAILYRTNAQSRGIEEALRMDRVPYRVVGGMQFFQRKEIKDVLAYLKLLVNPHDTVAFERVVNLPPRGIGAVTVEKILQQASQDQTDPLTAMYKVGKQSTVSRREKIHAFHRVMQELTEMAKYESVLQVMGELMGETGLQEYYSSDDSQEGRDRIENLESLYVSMMSVQDISLGEPSGNVSVADYLDRVSLLQPLDEIAKDDPTDAVTLMTVHAAKGLEFDCVFLCGLAEGLLPHANSLGDRASLEEERRLMYVAMTRAKNLLYLSYAENRWTYQGIVNAQPSRFLTELPAAGVHLRRPIRQNTYGW